MPTLNAKKDDELDDIWRRTRQVLRAELGERPFAIWIAPIRPLSADRDMIVLACTTHFERDRLASRYGQRIADIMAQFSGLERKVEFVAGSPPRLVCAQEPPTASLPPARSANANLVQGSIPVDTGLTFANFVTGPSNIVAFNEAQRLAAAGEPPSGIASFFGPTGHGKTHLATAYVWHVRERCPDRRILYLTSESFLGGFMAALKSKDTLGFKEMVRNVDVLICEDVQMLAGKQATLDEFFHSIDALAANRRQVILTADRSPSLIEQLPERLRSRLMNSGGIEIGPTDFDLRLAILQSKAKLVHEQTGFVVGDDVLRMMAVRISANARVLEGALQRIAMQSRYHDSPVTVANAQIWLSDFLRAHDRKITIDEIKRRVAERFGVRVSDLESKSRKRDVMKPRQIAYLLVRTLTNRSYPEIARKFGGRDHTTVMHGCEKIRQQSARDGELAAELEAIKRSLRDWASDPNKQQ